MALVLVSALQFDGASNSEFLRLSYKLHSKIDLYIVTSTYSNLSNIQIDKILLLAYSNYRKP